MKSCLQMQEEWKLMQQVKVINHIPIKSGEGRVIENEVRADQAADYAREITMDQKILPKVV